jgi:molybdopterin molybdotransferase
MPHNEPSSSVKMTQRLPATLTPLDAALRLLLEGMKPVEPIEVSLADSVGGIAAVIAPPQTAHPMFSVAVADGWAMRSRDITGASSYSPLPLSAPQVWVEAGDRLPEDSDCVLDPDMVEQTGLIFQVLAEAAPGHGIRRNGDDFEAGRLIVAPGRKVNALDMLALRAIGLDRVPIRSPRVGVIDVIAKDGSTASSQFVIGFAKAAGAQVIGIQTKGRDAASITDALDGDAFDLLITVGGTGLGRTDATIEALATRGAILAYGLALQPGRTVAVANFGTAPVIAAPGAPDQVLAVCLTLVQPALDLLAARSPRRKIIRPLARKISSSIGVEEIVLLGILDDTWMPIAAGQLSLDAIVHGDAWVSVPRDSEGYATGTEVGAFLLRDAT